jgi:hypothetical protein
LKRTVLAVVVAVAGVAAVPAAAQGSSPEDQLAAKYAPELRMKAQAKPCAKGDPYRPTDVDLIFGRDDVVLRGPWDRTNTYTFNPTVDDITKGDKAQFHLDFPGRATRPKCTYEQWSLAVNKGHAPVAYARVVKERGKPDQLALQYWFFYLFNDFNDKHEGDWEMVQLVFDAPTAEEALKQDPTRVGFSQHEGGEYADWTDEEKLERVDGTHPVIYPASGSHANYFRSALFLGRSAAQGVGCDDTTGPSNAFIPELVVLPSRAAAAATKYPWLRFQGHWGEQRPGFYNGPTGPNTKVQWTKPITWADEEWRKTSFPVPGGGFGGPTATGFFCGGVAAGSTVLTLATENPWPVLLGILALLTIVFLAAARTNWESSAPLHLARRRQWGQIFAASRRMYTGHFILFLGIGAMFIPVFLLAAAAQGLVLRASRVGALVDVAGRDNPFVAAVALAVGSFFFLFAVTLVQAATARAMLALDQGRTISWWGAYREVIDSIRSLLGALLRVALVLALLTLTFWLIPIGVYLLVRWSMMAQVVELEDRSAHNALRRSAQLVRGDWFWTAAITGLAVGGATLIGLLFGAGLLFSTGMSFEVVNLFTSIVYALLVPVAAIVTTYVYFDLRVNEDLRPEHLRRTEILPAEIEVGGGRVVPQPPV